MWMKIRWWVLNYNRRMLIFEWTILNWTQLDWICESLYCQLLYKLFFIYFFWNNFYWYFSVLNKICFVINILSPRCFGTKCHIDCWVVFCWIGWLSLHYPNWRHIHMDLYNLTSIFFYDLLLRYYKSNCTHLPPTVLSKTTFSHEIKLCLEIIYKMLL